ncbi:MAG: hypothetical protein IPL28_17295 [Chloroflexi bacterium]|nr:hypothetical protein [Chloroflexota bacterium]
MKRQVIALLLLLTLWLVSAVPVPAAVPAGLTTADWQAIQNLVPGSYFKASNTDSFDWFGQTVAVDGDTVVVGG